MPEAKKTDMIRKKQDNCKKRRRKSMKNKWIRKVMALTLMGVMMIGMMACGKQESKAPEAKKETKTETSAKKEESETVSYQFTGKYDNLAAHGMGWIMMLNCYDDGHAALARYNYVAEQGEQSAEDGEATQVYKTTQPLEEDFMTGEWKSSEKDGIDCLEITLHAEDENGKACNEVTVYAYDTAGTYEFNLSFPLVVGQKYTREITLSGNADLVYTDMDAFAAAGEKEE